MSDFARLLHADGPNPEHAAALQLYGRFVGDWDAEITARAADGARHTAPGKIHFGWVLEGRAVQDVWIIPRPAGAPAFPVAGNWYGTTLRVYDPTIDAWRISWFDPGRERGRHCPDAQHPCCDAHAAAEGKDKGHESREPPRL